MPKEFVGDAGSRRVFLDGKPLDPAKSQVVWNHSPDGFAWGYLGSGPAQLALAILLEVTDQKTAYRHYQQFKFDIIAGLPADSGFILPVNAVEAWLLSHAPERSKNDG